MRAIKKARDRTSLRESIEEQGVSIDNENQDGTQYAIEYPDK